MIGREAADQEDAKDFGVLGGGFADDFQSFEQLHFLSVPWPIYGDAADRQTVEH
jgi:hypothetical protein